MKMKVNTNTEHTQRRRGGRAVWSRDSSLSWKCFSTVEIHKYALKKVAHARSTSVLALNINHSPLCAHCVQLLLCVRSTKYFFSPHMKVPRVHLLLALFSAFRDGSAGRSTTLDQTGISQQVLDGFSPSYIRTFKVQRG